MCTIHESQKKKYYFILPHPLKNYLILSYSVPLSLSLSHWTLILSQNSLNLSSSHHLLVTLLSPSIASPSQATDRRSPHRPKSPIADPSQAIDRQLPHRPMPPITPSSQATNCFIITLLSADPAHRPTPSADPARRRCACLWLVIVDFVCDCWFCLV